MFRYSIEERNDLIMFLYVLTIDGGSDFIYLPAKIIVIGKELLTAGQSHFRVMLITKNTHF
jgi:hypothetical protein